MGSSFLRNRIINGYMMIDQRNAGASVTPTNTQYFCDRWWAWLSQASKLTTQVGESAPSYPAGFATALKVTSSSAYSVLSSDYFAVVQPIEGVNFYDLNWGTANAASATLSFWVRSSLTGTFGGAVANSAQNRSYVFTYTISSADTWEYKTITIPGDTTGTWVGPTNGIGVRVQFGLGVGSSNSNTAGSWYGANYISATGATSVVGTNGATWYITGVQLEAGSAATPFERRQFADEFSLCQRYYETSFPYGTAPANGGSVSTLATGACNITPAATWSNNVLQSTQIRYRVPKRAAAGVTTYGNSAGSLGYMTNGTLPTSGTTFTYSASLTLAGNDANNLYVNNQVAQAVMFGVVGGWAASAEL
jgi:hypothetical protein